MIFGQCEGFSANGASLNTTVTFFERDRKGAGKVIITMAIACRCKEEPNERENGSRVYPLVRQLNSVRSA